MAGKKLLIVESPAKAGTIQKYLGKDYTVMASMGHIIDLPKSQLAVDVEHDFTPRYITIRGKGPLLSQLKKEASKSSAVYLATDPDREGEAISWHLARALNIDPASKCRVTFNEITKTAVKAAIKEPRPIDMDLVNAQQARRVLDRIVGYKISPILWEKVKKGLSAGRVQSVATRLICDREEEIENFTPEEYWTISAVLSDPKSKKTFEAKYFGENGKEKKLSNGDEAAAILADAKNNRFIVSSVKESLQKRNPQPPFTTSTLQQDASRKLNFQAAKTMQTAQSLYEGVNLGGRIGSIGLITYMRTDSLRIADDALAEAVDFLKDAYGSEYVHQRRYKTRKNAQDAHEAIRPTSIKIKPDDIKDKLTNDQYKLYKLIWARFAASQMESAVYDTVNAVIDAGSHTFKAAGRRLRFKGYMAVYIEGSDTKEEKDKMLPKLEEHQKTELVDISSAQHFTQPPARYSDATLIKELEENGIGRPSTYAPTISTIVSRGYVVRNKKQLIPTELGMVTTDIMKNNFKDIVDVDFTAEMEGELDDIEEGKTEWVSVLNEFYPPFEKNLEEASKRIEKIKIKDEESDVICEKCGRKMVYKLSKFGKFLACPGYPECKNTKAIRTGTGVMCPKCGGEILVKKSRRGKTYYGCEHSPKCDFMAWDAPVKDEKCPKCGGLLLRKNGRSKKIFCWNENCNYERKL
ncbi:MAG TPA: type I DNA topoisomerase [Candidatus Ornithomonoglobus intestinigallinarum]|uniref:DNA topoisomerase 1 n=1 Tax=Candidatus Ornithomonoglobus intestinigallinarum TaxID=2840894 RepID=A0A9D1H1V2_9FIRM|nr:type I DNA topoisomerase [Candidatus Ornithomonoglobus intestinigallinarum]